MVNFVVCEQFKELEEKVDGIEFDANKINAISSNLSLVSSSLISVSSGLSTVSSNLSLVSSNLSSVSGSVSSLSNNLSSVSSSLSSLSSSLSETNNTLSSVSSSLKLIVAKTLHDHSGSGSFDSYLTEEEGLNGISKEFTLQNVVNLNSNGGFPSLGAVFINFNSCNFYCPNAPLKNIRVQCYVNNGAGSYDQDAWTSVILKEASSAGIKYGLMVGGDTTTAPFPPNSTGIYKIKIVASYEDDSDTKGFQLRVSFTVLPSYIYTSSVG